MNFDWMNKFWFVHRLVTTLAQELSVKIFRCWIIMCIKKYVHVKYYLVCWKNLKGYVNGEEDATEKNISNIFTHVSFLGIFRFTDWSCKFYVFQKRITCICCKNAHAFIAISWCFVFVRLKVTYLWVELQK